MDVYAANLVSENGESYIPASQRPDGTWRKARRVKEGYVPQEEVPLYESKGKQIANRNSKPQTITLPTGEVARQAIPGLFIVDEKDKEQKSKSKKKPKSSAKQSKEDIINKLERIKLKEVPKSETSEAKTKQNKQKKVEETKENEVTQNQSVDPGKRLKNLKKRLREVEALEEKLKNGSIAKPDPDQLKKVERKNDILLEIRQLEKQI
ncbi:partner of Y14 and mago [Agrilus planipennis]|uniref:Partner of Y14 and mago n=1 Tax=Agrilus planipennis TaxID=224129 RepID=A0A1W4XCU5_AGRPL|nr:partner of Y14 and mago [Agrilus planipennis]